MNRLKEGSLVEGVEMGTRGGKKRRSRKEKQKNEEKNKEKYKQAIKQLKDEIEKRMKTAKNLRKKKEPIGTMWGDELQKDDKWPGITKNKTMRIFGQNTNGISYQNGYLEWSMTMKKLDEYQADISCLAEINLDMKNQNVRKIIYDKTKKFDNYAKLAISNSNQSYTSSPYKPGGTITYVRGNWAGRVISQGQDELGRWSYVICEGKKGRKILFLTFYRVCKKTTETGGYTIRTQQERDLYDKRKSHKDPREVVLKDLEAEIQKKHKEGYAIFVFGDINDEVRDSQRVREFLQKTKLKNVMTTRFPQSTLPITYARGKKCLDILAMSEDLDDGIIVKCGILPMYHGMPADHRGFYVDLDVNQLFTNAYTDVGQQNYKRFNTSQVKKCDKYLYHLEAALEEHRIFTKIDSIKEKMENYLEEESGNLSEMIEECKILFNKTTELMIASDKKSGRAHYTQGKAASPKLTEAANDVIECRRLLSIERNKVPKDESMIERCQELVHEAKKELKNVQQNAEKIREMHLIELHNKKAKAWNLTAKQAAIVISEAEEAKRVHGKHKYYLKPTKQGATKHVYVPFPKTEMTVKESDITNVMCQTRVDDPRDVFNILLRQNLRHLMKSRDSIVTEPEIMEKIGRRAETEYVEKILQGVEREPLECEKDSSLGAFIKAMKYAEKNDGTTIKNFKWTYGVEEYKDTFSKTREYTACGPSGLHMSHWKAALERERIMKVHSFFMWAAFQFGFSFERWEVSWHVMLQKKDKPYSQKMRIIQLFEGDFNGALKYILGRKLMWHITSNGLVDADTYGSRIGKTATEAILNLQLIFDNCRIWKRNMGMIFNDADGCFDRIPPALADIALRRLGCPKNVVRTHTCAQQKMKHYVKTGSGVSKGYIQYSKTHHIEMALGVILLLIGPIGGVGQGGGASPIIWLAIVLMMLQVYKKSQEGIDIINRVTETIVKYWIISYVDDTTIVRGFKNNATENEMLKELKEHLLEWNKLLTLTGGALSLGKCKVALMKWKPDFWGRQKLQQNVNNKTVTIRTTENGSKECKLGRLEPEQAERILGIRLPMTGEMTREYDYRLKQMNELALTVYRSPFSPRDTAIIYQTRYKPMIRYALPITNFSSTELHEIQRKFIFYLLPKMGINRHTPRDVVYGPMERGGLGLMDLRIEQPIQAIHTNFGHIRRNDNAGKALLTTLYDTQIEVGISKPFYKANFTIHNYVTANTRWNYLWKACNEYKLNMEINNMWVPRSNYRNDSNLMDAAVKDKLLQKKGKLEIINNCRMYIGAFFISDLLKDSKYIDKDFLRGKRKVTKNEKLFKGIRQPPDAAWSLWREFIFRTYLINGYEVTPQPIQVTVQRNLNKTLTEAEKLYSMVPGIRLQETIRRFPPEFRQLLQVIEYPADDGLTLAIGMLQGTVLGASDGSIIETKNGTAGGFSYSLQLKDKDDNKIRGWSSTPASNQMTSLTSEMYGALATILLTYAVYIHYKDLLPLSKNMKNISIWIDNKETIKRSTTDKQRMNVSEFWAPEYDVERLIWDIKQLLPATMKFKWVKSHQDETKDGQKINGPFKREVQLNIEMDALAAKGLLLPQTKRAIYSHTVGGFYDNEGKLATNLSKFLYKTINGPTIFEYIGRKFNWEREDLDKIDWDALGQVLAAYSQHQRNKTIQLMYDWQNVGEQKEKFHQADGKCPGCDEHEYHMHYLECTNKRMMSERKKAISTFSAGLRAINTYPGCISIIVKGLLTSYAESIQNLECPNSYKDILLQEAATEQHELENHAMNRGMISKKWEKVQAEWCRETGSRHDPRRWSTKLIRHIHSFMKAMWSARNLLLHGENSSEAIEIRKAKCRERIRVLYKTPRTNLTLKDKKIFQLPLQYRLKGSIAGMTLWIDRAEMIFQQTMAKENLRQKQLITWWFPKSQKWKIQKPSDPG